MRNKGGKLPINAHFFKFMFFNNEQNGWNSICNPKDQVGAYDRFVSKIESGQLQTLIAIKYELVFHLSNLVQYDSQFNS